MTKKELTAWLVYGEKIKDAPRAFATVWAQARERFRMKGRAGETVLVLDGPEPTLLLGVSSSTSGDEVRAVHEAAVRAVETARRQKFDSVALGGVKPEHVDAAHRGLAAGAYSFRITKDPHPAILATRVLPASPAQRSRSEIIAVATAFARTLVNTPPGDKCPATIAARIAGEARKLKPRGARVRVEVWDEKKLARERCAGILAVGKGSDRPPRLLKLTYEPRGARKHLVLVGKGVTFDSGGLNVKTFEGMKTMKCDMAGSAAVTGAFLAAVRLGLPVKITVWAGFAENMLGGSAFKPGDVVTMRSGKTVEILNTDAEGRIVLGDLLNLAAAEKSDAIVDCATLTGACVVALGEEMAGLFSNDRTLVEKLLTAGDSVGELLWSLPLNRDFLDKLKGDVSDLKNIGGRYAGACTAAAFLAEFVGKQTWAHIDLAGPAFREGSGAGRPGGATGFGVATLVEFLARQK